MRIVVALLALALLAVGGLYANLWWDATSLADELEAQSLRQLTSPQSHRDAQTIAGALERGAAARGFVLNDLKVHVGPTEALMLGTREYRPNVVEFEFVARHRGGMGGLLHRKVKGTARVLVNQGPRDWPLDSAAP